MTTTGTTSPVVFNDLGGRSFTHPVTNYELTSEFDTEELRDSDSIYTALNNGDIVLRDGDNIVISLDELGSLDDRNAINVDGVAFELDGIGQDDVLAYDEVTGKFLPQPLQLSNARYLDLYDSVGGITISLVGWTDVPWESERRKDDPFQHISNSAEVEILDAGIYVMFFRCTTAVTNSTSRSESIIRLVLDNGTGYSEISGTLSVIYNRQETQGKGTGVAFAVMALNVGDKIKGQVMQYSGSADISTFGGGSSLIIFDAKGRSGDDGEFFIQNEGVQVENGPHNTLNFQGTNVDLTDAGGGKVNININLEDALPTLQVRRTSNYTVGTSWGDITFDTEDTVSLASVLYRDPVNTNRIYVQEDGYYFILAASKSTSTVDLTRTDLRIYKNGVELISGSLTHVINNINEVGELHSQAATYLTIGDYFTVQTMRTGANSTLVANTILIAFKMHGIKGDTGDKGDIGPAGSGTSIYAQDEGVLVPNGPFDTVNFTGDAVDATDGGSGNLNVNITRATLPVYGTDFQYAESLVASTSNSTTFINKVTLGTTNLPNGTYKITIAYSLLHSGTSNAALVRVQINGVDIGQIHRYEPKDNLNVIPAMRVFYRILNGVNLIALDYSNINGDTTIYDATIEVVRTG